MSKEPKDAERGYRYKAMCGEKRGTFGGYYGRGDTVADAVAALRAATREAGERERGWKLVVVRCWDLPGDPTLDPVVVPKCDLSEYLKTSHAK